MIRVTCPGCGSVLNAKKKLCGQTRSCPKCGGPVQIPPASLPESGSLTDFLTNPQANAEPTPIVYANPAESRLPNQVLLARLNRNNLYLICDKTMVMASWRNDGKGWMFRVASGFLPARRNTESLPHYGNFILVELQMRETDQGMRLEAIESYQLASRFAMTKLDKGDDDIVEAITGHGGLNRDQKFAVRQALADQFMRDVWADSAEVVKYLSDADYHSYSSRQGSSPGEYQLNDEAGDPQ